MLLLLLAVCGNTANLVLARASARQKEMGVRLALGARPWRIASLLLTENLVLALIGAALGAAIAVWGTQALPRSADDRPSCSFPDQRRWLRARVCDAARHRMRSAHRRGAGGAARTDRSARGFRSGARTAGRSRLRNALMGVQVALALVVLLVAGLFFRNFMETRDTDPGFRREGVLLAAYDLAGRNADPAFSRGTRRRGC